jgi:hypothetical protein
MNIQHPIEDKITEALNNALKGELFEPLRGITISYHHLNKLEIIFYIDGEITEEVADRIDTIDTYFLSHMPENFKSNVRIIRSDEPNPIEKLQKWVYLRDFRSDIKGGSTVLNKNNKKHNDIGKN